jgi:photosystem II stability/assembly factor-like uncharacterized protein
MKNLIIFSFLFATISFISCDQENLAKSDEIKFGDWEIIKTEVPFRYASQDLFFVNEDVGYTCGFDGAIKRTIDAGETWEHLQSNTRYNLNDVFFLNENIGFVSGKAYPWYDTINTDEGSILLKTIDGGESWTHYNFIDYLDLTSLHFFDEMTGLAVIEVLGTWGNTKYVGRTTDGGMTWNKVDKNYNNHSFYGGFQAVDGAIFFMGVPHKIQKSTDEGFSWTEISTPDEHLDHASEIYFYDEQTGIVYSSISSYKTVDGGLNWLKVDMPYTYHVDGRSIIHLSGVNQGISIGREYDFESTSGEFGSFLGSTIFETDDGWESRNESEIFENLLITKAYFVTKELGYGLNSTEFYTIKNSN